jgi:hypothetical protein
MPFTPRGRIGGAGLRIAREKLRDPEQPPEFYRPVFPCSIRGGCDRRGTTRQPNTHSTERREVYYPWHPWYGRSVRVYEALVQKGQAVFRCGTEENRAIRHFVPQWMFDPAACCRMHMAPVPLVGFEALRDLKALLRGVALAPRDVVLKAQHRSLVFRGGADANVQEPIPSRSIPAVSSTPPQPVLAGITSGNPTDDGETARPTAARALAAESACFPGKGGAE